eukprot:1162228-Alexandrium_andersonii.AAC.1
MMSQYTCRQTCCCRPNQLRGRTAPLPRCRRTGSYRQDKAASTARCGKGRRRAPSKSCRDESGYGRS